MLITSRTPLRVSFFGGSTDYPEYYKRFPGAVVGMAINRYVYISALRLATFIQYKYRLSYSVLELAQEVCAIRHPAVRSILEHYGVDEPLDINIISDLPASSGLGSSSSFTVGFVNLVSCLRGKQLTKLDLARAAIHVERELLQERVGVQDQLHASFGGINRFDFVDGGRFRISPVQMTGECLDYLLDSLVLVYTGIQRYASETLSVQIKRTKEGQVDNELKHLFELTGQAVSVLEGTDPERLIKDLGHMIHDGWMTKRSLSPDVSNPEIDRLYEQAIACGALGGKLCGAGGGGFLLMIVPPGRRAHFEELMRPSPIIPVGIDTCGSVILTESARRSSVTVGR
jgi:D-glycero-alpha-D-manno-heptose-7-phosphate kinase